MRDCGDCGECCHGRLFFNEKSKKGEDIIVSNGISCFKLLDENCSIWEDRPDVCRNWQCTWSLDEELPVWLQPSKCGFMIWEPREELNHYSIVFSDTVQINQKALLWTLWWANDTKKDIKLFGPPMAIELFFKNS